jgi:hypothetical protein
MSRPSDRPFASTTFFISSNRVGPSLPQRYVFTSTGMFSSRVMLTLYGRCSTVNRKGSEAERSIASASSC